MKNWIAQKVVASPGPSYKDLHNLEKRPERRMQVLWEVLCINCQVMLFLEGGGAYGVGVGEGDGVRCHGQVEGTRSILAVPNMLGGSKSVWLSPCT